MPHEWRADERTAAGAPRGLARASRCRRSSCRSRYFRPRRPRRRQRLWAQSGAVRAAAGPRFISVTCGAGGTGEDGTLPLVAGGSRTRFGLPVAAHLTCACAARAEIDALARATGSRRPPDRGAARRCAQGQRRAIGRARTAMPMPPIWCRAQGACADFEISVGCYPEVHPEAASAEADLDNLRAQGRCRAPTGWSPSTASTPTGSCASATGWRAAGIEAEFVPGHHADPQLHPDRRFSRVCGAGIPAWLDALFDGVERRLAAARHGRRQRRRRAVPPAGRRGPDQLHLYALNRAELPLALCQLLGGACRPGAAAA